MGIAYIDSSVHVGRATVTLTAEVDVAGYARICVGRGVVAGVIPEVSQLPG